VDYLSFPELDVFGKPISLYDGVILENSKEMRMERISYDKADPKADEAMMALENYVAACGLEASLLELVKLRASQINGCAYCLDMHTKDARARGETEQRLYLLQVWAEVPFYSDREKAALAWTEAITKISETHAPDSVYKEAHKHFKEAELVALTMTIIAINGWNRIAIAFRLSPGAYQPAIAVSANRN
jgi:AhpD family alkylhydroperoxidase